jgi:hypothetical protein
MCKIFFCQLPVDFTLPVLWPIFQENLKIFPEKPAFTQFIYSKCYRLFLPCLLFDFQAFFIIVIVVIL